MSLGIVFRIRDEDGVLFGDGAFLLGWGGAELEPGRGLLVVKLIVVIDTIGKIQEELNLLSE
jgi:hypothetical protein